MVWQKLKKAFGFSDMPGNPLGSNIEGSQSIHKMVNQNNLNKRKNVRINYPHFGAAGLYPHIVYMGKELNIANISLGGLLVIDDAEQFGQQIGEVVNLEFSWDDFSTKIRARVVGANLQRRHIQFVDFNAQAFLRISLLVKSGHLGQRFHRVRNDSGTLQAEEMWLGPTGETLVFLSKETAAELSLNKEKFLIQKGQPTLNAFNKHPVAPSLMHDLMILLANFPQPTANVKELIESLEAEARALRPKSSPGSNFSPPTRTGSHG